MFLSSGLLSANCRPWPLVAGAAIFAAGLAAGASMGSGRDPAVAIQAPSDVETTSSIPITAATRGSYSAQVLRVSDGDTFEARVNVWPGIDITTKVRLRGIDTPELKARCADERMKAEAARNSLTKILAEGDVEIRRVTIDKFGGRVDADASTRSTPDISTALLQAGVARSYGGGRRESWCF